MKRFWILTSLVVMGLAACAKKDPNFAKNLANKNAATAIAKSKSQQAVKTSATAATDSANTPQASADQKMCTSPQEAVCGQTLSPMVKEISNTGRTKALESLKKKYPDLPADFNGSQDAVDALTLDSKEQIKADYLMMADQNYRLIYDYDADLKEAGEIARKIVLDEIKNSADFSETDKATYAQAINETTIRTATDILSTGFEGSDLISITYKNSCHADGLHLYSFSGIPRNASKGYIYFCPGNLLLNAGLPKEDRITSLVFALGHEFSHQLQFKGLNSEDKAWSCLQGTIQNKSAAYFSNRAKESVADIWGTRVLMSYLKSTSDVKIKKQKIAMSLKWLCYIDDAKEDDTSLYFTNKTRIENVLKQKETEEQISCGNSPRC